MHSEILDSTRCFKFHILSFNSPQATDNSNISPGVLLLANKLHQAVLPDHEIDWAHGMLVG